MDMYPQVNDEDFELRREYCEQCAGGRPICADICQDAAVAINEMIETEEREAELAFEVQS